MEEKKVLKQRSICKNRVNSYCIDEYGEYMVSVSKISAIFSQIFCKSKTVLLDLISIMNLFYRKFGVYNVEIKMNKNLKLAHFLIHN